MPEARILVATSGQTAQVRVIGRGTFKVSQPLRDFAIRAIRRGATQVIIELSACTFMDSTFMGVLAMIGLENLKGTEVVIVNADERNHELLKGLGVAKLFRFAQTPVNELEWTSLCQAAAGAVEARDVAETVLDAHRTLMAVDPENVPRFRDVVEVLAEEIRSDAASAGDKNEE
jgi:anti-anti-sigma regulatory factor